jgi:hypothetical protein
MHPSPVQGWLGAGLVGGAGAVGEGVHGMGTWHGGCVVLVGGRFGVVGGKAGGCAHADVVHTPSSSATSPAASSQPARQRRRVTLEASRVRVDMAQAPTRLLSTLTTSGASAASA